MDRRNRSERGSTTVEATISLSLIITLVTGGFAAGYFAFAYVWCERASYEALVCLASTATESACSDSLRNDVSRTLPFGVATEVRLLRDVRRAQVHFGFTIEGHKWIGIHKTLSLPLLTGLP